MKLSTLLLISALALLCLFSLQAFWLYYTYQLHLEGIKESINSFFYQTVEKELDLRYLELNDKLKKNSFDTSIRIVSFDADNSGLENKSVASQQFDMIQQLMATSNINFSIVNSDSIFRSFLQSNRYPFQYQINYADSAGRVINTAGQIVKKGFKTEVLSVVNGEKIYAVVKITPPVVFRNMLAILTVSILIFFFIIACLVYEMKIFLNQHYLSQLRDNFTNALTHDTKTPLATIHSVLVQLEKGDIYENPELRKKFSSIAIEQVLTLQNIVNQILTLAYIEKRQLELNKQSVNLPVMIQSLIDEFTIKSNKVVTFQTFYDLKDRIVYADLFYLNNVISNLIDNAIKYSFDPVEIVIECMAEEKQIHIRVKDNGFGISPDDQLKIFNRFERGAEIKRDRISGFGIGLNYVQQVIGAHGGSITVLSQEGVGSEFFITLPNQVNIKEENIIK